LVSLTDLHLGVPVGIAIAIHNIPEGLACCVPLYCATSDRKKSCLLSFAAGMTEPLGGVVAVLLLYPFLNAWNLAAASALVAGFYVEGYVAQGQADERSWSLGLRYSF